ncbi:LysM peptidoglycan-binding domain-containing protein [Jatrophihabitans sp.]|uniref:LysM peptidoglycan-binding domain-containing protein n=1 Tax=Jatrophihabitans sp. TaxID=1932789 RepID=UPI002C23DE49|nr:LysM peptidoglycan-binding domain-containing protein [Jatrophihabitans sp.]
MQRHISAAALAGMALGSGFVLTAGTPHFGELVQDLSAPRQWLALAGPDAAVATLAGALLWLVALWVAVSLALTAGSLLPGRLGALARAVARRLTPAALRRVVVAAAGASILLTPVTALAAPAGSPVPGSTPSAMPAVGWPTDPTPSADPTTSAPAPQVAPRFSQGTGRDARSAGQVTVRPGDSLWSIAARRLGTSPPAARIQQEWPRWYAANRHLIGADPGLILPGTRLVAPQPGSRDAGA